MRRTALSVLALTAVAGTAGAVLVAPVQADAAHAPHASHHAPAVVRVSDPVGDVTARTGSLSGTDDSPDGFKPGEGTAVAPTAADRAIDLTRVTYRVVRSGTPRLQITYRAAGPFQRPGRTPEVTAPDGSTTSSLDAQGLETMIGGGRFSLVAFAGHGAQRYGIQSGLFAQHGSQQRAIPCAGLRTSMKPGAGRAAQSVPLSCLRALGVRSSKLRSVGFHTVVRTTVTTASSGSHGNTTITAAARIASDAAALSRRVSFVARRG